ncbi:MAG: ABC transporter permease [Candidatus Poribacteria bacterium]|nr:ABC transporter permease [Candidatus Poribacteria bacterium]
MSRFLLGSISLWKREVVRFYRQRNRVIGALMPPLFIWFFLGSGFGKSFSAPGMEGAGYLEFFYPGVIALVVLFTSIYSAMSLIEDRRDGYLQGVLVSPMPRSAIIFGKVLGGTSQGFVQGVLLLILAPFIGIEFTLASVALILAIILTLSFGLTAFGIMMAWRTDSVSGFHAIMNFILMPMWLLSGAFFPVGGSAVWLNVVMRLNPLTYGVEALRGAFYAEAGNAVGLATLPAMFVMLGFGAVIFAATVMMANRPVRTS